MNKESSTIQGKPQTQISNYKPVNLDRLLINAAKISVDDLSLTGLCVKQNRKDWHGVVNHPCRSGFVHVTTIENIEDVLTGSSPVLGKGYLANPNCLKYV